MISIKVPENLLIAIDKTAFRQGKSRTQFMLDSCRSEFNRYGLRISADNDIVYSQPAIHRKKYR